MSCTNNISLMQNCIMSELRSLTSVTPLDGCKVWSNAWYTESFNLEVYQLNVWVPSCALNYLIKSDTTHSKALKSLDSGGNKALLVNVRMKTGKYFEEKMANWQRAAARLWLLTVHPLGSLKPEMSTLPVILSGNQLFDTHRSCCEFSDLYLHQSRCN